MDPFTTPQQTERRTRTMQLSCSQTRWSSDSEEEKHLNEFQKKMKKEHRQAMAKLNRACVVMERNRRKRITVSCSKLRQLLPKVQGVRSDMVTVLEMTIAFLELVHEFSEGAQYREILYPPEEVHGRWLLEAQMRGKQTQKRACDEEWKRKGPRRKSRTRKKPLSTMSGRRESRRRARSDYPTPNVNCSNQLVIPSLQEAVPPPQRQTEFLGEAQNTMPPVLVEKAPDKFSAPSFWSPAIVMSLMSPVSRHPQEVSWANCSTPSKGDSACV